MRWWMMGILAIGCAGCTMMSLERNTVAQGESAVDLRYQEVLKNLALIAHDPSAVPSYASIFSGTLFVQDQGQLVSTNIFPFIGGLQSGSIAGNPSFNREISQNWLLDPIVAPEKLEAIRAACQWAIGGPDYVYPGSRSLLIRPDQAPPGQERHFSVADRLAKLPPGWLCVGRLEDVPPCARYKAHCGHTWVWVAPHGMKGFVEFTLIIQDIARVGINSATLFNFPPVYSSIVIRTKETTDNLNDPDARTQFHVQVVVDQSGHLVTAAPYWKLRVENLGNDSGNLRSIIGAAGIATVPH